MLDVTVNVLDMALCVGYGCPSVVCGIMFECWYNKCGCQCVGCGCQSVGYEIMFEYGASVAVDVVCVDSCSSLSSECGCRCGTHQRSVQVVGVGVGVRGLDGQGDTVGEDGDQHQELKQSERGQGQITDIHNKHMTKCS